MSVHPLHFLPRVAFLIAAVVSVCSGAVAPPEPETPLTAKELAQGYSETRILAMPRTGALGLAQAAEIREGLGVRREFSRFRGLRVLELRGASPSAAIERLRASGLYEFVEPDYIRIATVVPNDPRFAEQWALNNNGSTGGIAGADIKAPTAWDTRTSAASVIVAVIDSGVRLTHQDIAANLWVNAGETAGNGQDDDGNGYVDDVHGINAIVVKGTVASGNPNDDGGHGSHVAGIIGAVGNNGVGISGVAWNVRIMPLKFLRGTGGGLISDAIECIDYAIAKGAHVINASYGAEDPKTFSQAELEAIRRARDASIVFVAAAGNDGLNMDVSRAYPASYPLENIIAVGNSTELDDPAPSSNFGSGAVELFAPGSDILSLGIASNSDYVSLTGTSMAAPHVSGAIALLKAQFPVDSYRGLINRALRGVQVKPAFATRAQTRGRLDLNLALTTTTNRPFNDDFAGRAIITGSNFAIRTSNALSTAEPGEPTHAGIAGNRSLWWSWTPSASANVTFDTTGSTIDTLLAVYTGSSLASLVQVQANDNFSGTSSRLQLNVVAGTTYQVAVDGKAGATGLVLLNIGSVPANDNFAGAQIVSGDSVLVETTNANASREAGEPFILGNTGGRSLWYRWTAPSTKRYQISAYSIDVDTLAAVYTGNSLASLALVNASDNTGANTSALCTIEAVAGTSYYIAIDAKESLSGSITFSIVDSLWQFSAGDAITGSPAVAPDGTIYVGSTDGNLYAISPAGAQLWAYQTGGLIDTCSPAIAPDGTIYTGSFDSILHAVNPNGSQKWRFTTGGLLSNSPAIASNGTVYIKSDDNFLYAISPAGVELWRFNTGGVTYASPVIAPDGTIYVGSGNSRFFAVNPNGTQKWQFVADGDTYATAAIDAAGNVYFGTLTGRLYSLTSDGVQRWSYMPGGPMSSSPALSSDGTTVYFGAYDHFLHAVNTANGTARWTYNLGDEVRASSPLVAADGSIYIGVYDGRLQAVNSNGTLKRFYAAGNWIRSSPVIVGTTLYFGSNDNKLYAVPAGVGPAAGPWPFYRNNPQRTGRSGIDPNAFSITQQPQSQIVQPGGSFTLTVTTSGATPTGYQWFKDGNAISGATAATYSVAVAVPSDSGTYHVVITGPLGNISSATANIVVPAPGGSGRIVNLSVRSPAGTGSGTLVVGLYAGGSASGTLPVLVRGMGPTLLGYNVPDALADPQLTLFNSAGTPVESNNDWGGDSAIAEALPRVGAFGFESTASKDAALLASLAQGGFTAHITAADGGAGVALAEIYDAAATEPPLQLLNISARSHVGTGNGVLIVGFAIRNEPRTLLIRGIGPELAKLDSSITTPLVDPKLELFDINQVKLFENDDWLADDAVRFSQAGAFALPVGSKDAAMVVTLPPGTYSAVISGVGGTTGIGLVEVYALSEPAGAQPAWRDEFYQSAGAGPDPAKWTYDLGGGGWGNQELESYTADRANSEIVADPAALDGRAMVIRAVRTPAGAYTSARLKTQGRFNATYGRIEARMKMPVGQGIWPAFWMLGANIGTVGWPACGEIDVMEYLGHEPQRVYGTLHGPGYSGASSIGASTTLPGNLSLAAGYHVYAVEWSPGKVEWSIDGTIYHTVTPANLPGGATWVFNNNPHFLLLNLAVGGLWPGNPDGTTVFPQEFRIDYVRVYDLGGG
jgi:outer membrane protein assembly factor BamB/subtilisin family serine protease/beta-glucanase (GH16 family)